MLYFLNKEFNIENMKQALAEFECQRCEKCCCLAERFDSIKLSLLPHEVPVLAKMLNMSNNQFRNRYCVTDKGKVSMLLPCPFYSVGGRFCSIWQTYGKKMLPHVCVQFPFNKTIEKNGKKWMTCGDCPGGKLYAEEHHLMPEDYGVKV